MNTKLTRPIVLGIVASTLWCGCQSSEPSDTLKQAHEAHQEAMAIYAQSRKLLDSLKAAQPDNEVLLARLDSVSKTLTVWEENLWEVPGFEHSHDHDHEGHAHHHTSAPSMTDASMLEYQLEAKKAIEEVHGSLRQR